LQGAGTPSWKLRIEIRMRYIIAKRNRTRFLQKEIFLYLLSASILIGQVQDFSQSPIHLCDDPETSINRYKYCTVINPQPHMYSSEL
jgi:hypothetical protein